MRVPHPQKAYIPGISFTVVEPKALADGWSRDQIISEISSLGYPAFRSCSEIYLEKCFRETGFILTERLSVARQLGETSLMFLVHLLSLLIRWLPIAMLCAVWSNGLAGKAHFFRANSISFCFFSSFYDSFYPNKICQNLFVFKRYFVAQCAQSLN